MVESGYNREVFQLNSDTDPKGYLDRAVDLESDGQFEEAIKFYSSAIEEYGEHPAAYEHRAHCYYMADFLQAAMDDYSRLITMDSTDGLSYLNRANIYYDLEKYQEAWDDLQVAVKFIPGNPEVHLVMGDLNQIGNELDQAVRSYEKALSLDPDMKEARHNRLLAYRDSKMWWIFDRIGIYLGLLARGRGGSYSAAVTKDERNKYLDQLTSMFSGISGDQSDTPNNVNFTDVDLEKAIDGVIGLDLLLSVDRDGPPFNWIAWLDRLEADK